MDQEKVTDEDGHERNHADPAFGVHGGSGICGNSFRGPFLMPLGMPYAKAVIAQRLMIRRKVAGDAGRHTHAVEAERGRREAGVGACQSSLGGSAPVTIQALSGSMAW